MSTTMFIYRFNQYTGKYYTYDTDEYDIFSPMFDETIHPSNDEFGVNPLNDESLRNKCAFCNTSFETRNQLFKHLGYMGIDIRHNKNESTKYHPKEDKGDYGLTLTKSENKMFSKRAQRKQLRKQARKNAKAISKLTEDLDNCRITGKKHNRDDAMDVQHAKFTKL